MTRPCPHCKGRGLVAPFDGEPFASGEDCPTCDGDGVVVGYHPWGSPNCPKCGRVHPVDASCEQYDPHVRAMAEASQ
jgi:DnaJ-class molecular chaperone